MFTVAVFFVACCICRLPELVYHLRYRREIAGQPQPEAHQNRREIKQLTAAAIFVNPSGNSVTVGTLSEDCGQTSLHLDQSKEQEEETP